MGVRRQKLYLTVLLPTKANPGKLRQEFNATRKERFPWMGEVSNYVYVYPSHNQIGQLALHNRFGGYSGSVPRLR